MRRGTSLTKIMASRFMLKLSYYVLVAVFATLFMTFSTAQEELEMANKVLFISFDGFRWDYINRTEIPNFDRLVRDGVTADYVTSSFITKTFPTHYTLVTGLYQESHGFVGNQMYDPELDAHWTIRNQSKSSVWWDDGEPIWVTNQKQGFQSGVFQYPGMDIKIRRYYPTYRLPKYDGDLANKDVVDLVVPLFANNSINLGILYFSTMDRAGHTFGPDSQNVINAIQESDDTIGYLISRLEAIGMLDEVNIIVTGDHGMMAVSNDKVIRLDDYIDSNLFNYDANNPIFGIWPKNDNDSEVIYDALLEAHPHLKVYKKADIPDRYHYKNHRRIAPILVMADEHWQITTGNWRSTYLGNHGYDNRLESMRVFLVAHGPAFKQGYHSEAFSSVDFYPMICHILGIKPSPNNGSMETAIPMFSC